MRTTKRAIGIFALLALVAGCGGGSGGGHAPTIVTGNVISASAGTTARSVLQRLWQVAVSWWRAEATAQVPGITVAISGTSNAGLTDDQGFFRLEGNQFGPVALLFTGNGANASLPVTLPAGGELDLLNVALAGSDIEVGEERIHFNGPITGIDCQANLLQVLSGEQVPFRVRLQSGTVIVDQSGNTLGCTALFAGSNADVQGTINSQGDVLALVMTVNPTTTTTTATQTVDGSITTLECPAAVEVNTTQGNVQVSINSSTQIKGANGDALQCTQLLIGDRVHVEGTQTGFGINASEIDRLAPTPTPTPGS
jgi:hypothetical protein